MSQDVNMIITCNHETCPYNHELECDKDILWLTDDDCEAKMIESEDKE